MASSASASALDDVFEFLTLATKLEGKNRIEAATKVNLFNTRGVRCQLDNANVTRSTP